MYTGLDVKYPLFLSDFTEPLISSIDFENYTNNKIFGGSQVVPCEQKDRLTNMKKLIVAFRNFTNAPENNLCTFGC
jgi:hypothetical protein